ncbi:Urease accessory protein UreE [Aquisphaera giovannonii]|uniref:Urease accessory protein UreE n=1 Tax=Aquisphaera giovannonii TaxID=406548 RepID=A0A5B9WDJ8_9BACT|nr:urease accessory protein UreE [Aquisphaera giovannonii]QEH38738.1 Urease accessory protein UreE [Aquisphaera giovannonii]
MLMVEKPVGNLADPSWADRLATATVDVLELDQWHAQKNRFRLKTRSGAEVAVALDRGSHLRDGDILGWDEGTKTAIAVRIRLQEVLVIHLDALLGEPAEALARTCFELGHALGNQHWPAIVKGTEVYVPLTVDRRVMDSVMRTHAFAGVTHEFRPGLEVIPFLAPHEARRLFGGADSTPHSHAKSYEQGRV